VNLTGFPRRTLRGDRTLHRIHRTASGPWWFSSTGSGRFDPVGTGSGACYVAEAPLGAWVEVFRKRMLLAEAEVRQRSLLSVQLGRDVRLANLTSRRALAFGVTASLGADEHYDESQAFAVSAVHAGFGGIRYLLRHDPAQHLYGVALFGDAGSPATTDRATWPADAASPIPDALVAEARQRFGYRVLPVP
jgi:RES domain-containing protein